MYNYTFFHGSALVRLLQDSRVRELSLKLDNNGYLVNNSAFIYLKHCTKRLTPWSFTFLPEHIKEITEMRKLFSNTYIVLICSDDGVCCISYDDFSRLIYIGDTDKSKTLRVSRTRGEKYSISGSDGNLTHKIGNIDFPRKILSL